MGLFEHFPYVNFHEKNIDWILRDIKKRDDDIADLQERMTAAEGNITNLFTITTSLDGRVTICETRITAAETDISGLKTRVTAAESNITDLQGRMTEAESDIDDLETGLSSAQSSITSHGLRLSLAETNIAALEAREQIPAHTAADAGKVLKVTSANGLAWQSEGASTAGIPLYIDLGSASITPSQVASYMATRPVYCRYTRPNPQSGEYKTLLFPLYDVFPEDDSMSFYDGWGWSQEYFNQPVTQGTPCIIDYYQGGWDSSPAI